MSHNHRSIRERLAQLAVGAVSTAAVATAAVMVVPDAAQATPFRLTGVEYRSYTYPSSGQDRKEAVVDCPGTTVVVGTGFTITGGSSNVFIEDVIPSRDSVTVRAEEGDAASTQNWSLTARAVCADMPPGWMIESEPSTLGPGPSNVASVQCPDDRVAIGVGFDLSDTNGQLALTDLELSNDQVTVTMYEDDTGTSLNWAGTAYAVCAYELDGLYVTSRNASPGITSENTACRPATENSIGAIGHLNNGAGNVRLTGLKASNYLNTGLGFTNAQLDQNGTSLPYDLVGQLICVRK